MGELTTRNQVPQQINIFLESLTSRLKSAQNAPDYQRAAEGQKDEAILLLLAKMALVYWRPDFTPAQAKQLYAQYLDDLRPFAFADIAEAFQTYRQNPENKFFPTPGQLRGLIATPYSWDPSPSKHLGDRLAAGREEMQRMMEKTPEYQAFIARQESTQQLAAE